MNFVEVVLVLVCKVVGINDVESPVAPAMLLDELDEAEKVELGPTVPAVLIDDLDVVETDELVLTALAVEVVVLAGELALAAPAVELTLLLGLGLALMAPAVELGDGVVKDEWYAELGLELAPDAPATEVEL